MYLTKNRITDIKSINPSTFIFQFYSPEIASTSLPGQFINIKIDETSVPLLRRPFSVYNIVDNEVEVVFAVSGIGTKKLSQKKIGEYLDVIGPLGKPFNINEKETISILIAGGLGVAPLPLLTKMLDRKEKSIRTFLGGKTKEHLITTNLKNLDVATDDGSFGYSGNVVDLLHRYLSNSDCSTIKIYGCGPTPMLKALSIITDKFKIPCEVSLETYMACGFGICQGCAVEMNLNNKKYSLTCKDGPVFNLNEIIL